MRRFLPALTACWLVTALAHAQNGPGAGAAAVPRERPHVNIQPQAGAPLRLSASTKWATADQQMLEVYFAVENVGAATVRAYAVRVVGDWGGNPADACFFRNIEKRGKLLQPRQSAGTSTWRPVPASVSTPAVELVLDFVEFTDGTVWGADACQAAEQLGGLRAGGREARAALKRVLQTAGPEALLEKLMTEQLDVEPPRGRSAVWTKAFRGGLSTVLERLRRAHDEGGLPEVEAALQKPFDAADDN